MLRLREQAAYQGAGTLASGLQFGEPAIFAEREKRRISANAKKKLMPAKSTTPKAAKIGISVTTALLGTGVRRKSQISAQVTSRGQAPVICHRLPTPAVAGVLRACSAGCNDFVTAFCNRFVTGQTSIIPNVYADCYRVTGQTPQVALHRTFDQR